MRNAEVIRQWQILREIEARRTGVTIHELATQVRVSTRTIRRDLQALQEAGFAVYDEGEENETKPSRAKLASLTKLQRDRPTKRSCETKGTTVEGKPIQA